MPHEKSKVNLDEVPWKVPLSLKQRSALPAEELEEYKVVEIALWQREDERDKVLKLKKEQALARRDRSLEISMFSDEILKIAGNIKLVDSNEIGIMLMKQAVTLQEIFRTFLGRMDLEQSLDGKIAYGQIALRSQSLCRKTLGTLIEMRNPRRSATFIKQQNNAQINVNSDKQTSEN